MLFPHFKEDEGPDFQRCSAIQRGTKVLGSIFKHPRASLLFEIISNFVNNFGQVEGEQNHLKNCKLSNL